MSGTSSVTIRSGGLLYIHNQSDQQQNDRINNAAPFNMHGGSFQYDQNQSDFGTVPAETLGALNILNGNNTITTDFSHANDTQVLTFGSLNRSPGAAVNFQGFNTSGDIGIGEGNSRNRVVFTTIANTAGGIIGGNAYHTKDFNAAATQDNVHFATYAADVDTVAAGAQPSVAAFTAYNTGAESSWIASSVANPAADVLLTGARTLEAIRLGGGIDVDAATFTLNLSQGGLLHNGASSTISNGTLTAGGATAGELAIRVEDNLTASVLTISAVVADNGGAVSVLKTGADTLELSGANTYTGRTTVAGGVLNIAADTSLGAAPGVATPGHLRLFGGTLALPTGTATLDPNRGLELGGGASTITAGSGANLVYDVSGITSNGASSLTITGNVDMAVSGATTIGGSLIVAGATTIGQTVVSLSGTTNIIGESLAVGAASNSATMNYNVPGGVLTVGLASPNTSNLDVGARVNGPTGASANFPNVGVLDLSGSDNLIAKVDRVRVGVLVADPSADQNTRGTLTLPTNSTIVAGTEVLVSDSPGDQLATHPSLVTFGSGISTLTTRLLTVGGRKSNGTVTIAPGGTLNYSGFGAGTGDLRIAFNNNNTGTVATGTFNMGPGTLIADLDEIIVAHRSGTGGSTGGSIGTLTLGTSAANVVRANSLLVGDLTGDSPGTITGTVNMGGGSFSVATNVTLASRPGTTGTVNGTLNLTGGTFTVGGNIVTSDSTSANATITVDGGALDMTNGTISADALSLRAGTLSNVAEVYTGDGFTPAPLVKSTLGTVTLAGVNAYTGATTVNDGTLLVSGSVTGSLVDVIAGTLGGTGSITNTVKIGDASAVDDAFLAPGASIGTLATGDVTFESDGVFKLEINSGTITTDLLSSTGVVNLGGIVSLSAVDLGSVVLGNSQVFTFITALNGIGGTFEDLPDGAQLAIGLNTFTVDYTNTTVSLVAVPEPGSAAVLLCGLASIVGLRRSRRGRE